MAMDWLSPAVSRRERRSAAGGRARRPGARWPGVAFGLLLLAALVAGCSPPAQHASGAGRALYVANGEDATISRLDSASGRLTGPAVPAGRAPWQIAIGPGGNLLVLSVSPRRTSEMTYLTRDAGSYTSRPVLLEPTAREGQMASDGRYAAVAYHVPGPTPTAPVPRCRLALVDLVSGDVLATHRVCDIFESVFSIAVQDGAAGPVAYIGLWRWPHPDAGGEWIGGAGRLIALDALGGTILNVLPLQGAPSNTLLASGPYRTDQRIYLVETVPGPESEYSSPQHWDVRSLDPVTLETLSLLTLAEMPLWLAVDDQGLNAYYAIGGTNSLMHLDLLSGAVRHLATLPGFGLGMAVSHDRLFVPNPEGSEVWVVDRRNGRLQAPMAVGRHPIGVVISQ